MDTKRKDGREAIRHQIGRSAAKLLDSDILSEAERRFVKAFTALEDTSKRSLLPTAIAAGMKAAFEGTDLAVWREVKLAVHVIDETNANLAKSIDFLIISKADTADCRAVAVEVKATMEFNSLAAALMELAIVTERSNVVIKRKQTEPLLIVSTNICCITLSCYDNQHIEPLLSLMSRQLWPDKRRRITHHRLFLESKNANPLTPSLGVHEFLDDITKWCLPSQPGHSARSRAR